MGRKKKVVIDVDSSNVELKDLGKFDLAHLHSTFQIADFERRLYQRHVGRIKSAIALNRMMDHIITVFEKPTSTKYTVIDGMHRLMAYSQLFDEKKIKSFPIMVRIISAKNEKEARSIYLAINSGKSLTAKDVLKAFDDGSLSFFNELKLFCTHDGDQKHMSYHAALSALFYIKNEDNYISMEEIEEFVKNVHRYEAARLQQLLVDMYSVFGRNTKEKSFKANIFRPVARIYFEKFEGMKEKKFIRFLRALQDDETIKKNAGTRTIDNFNMMYEYLLKKFEAM